MIRSNPVCDLAPGIYEDLQMSDRAKKVVAGVLFLAVAAWFGWVTYIQTAPPFGPNPPAIYFFGAFALIFGGVAAWIFWIAYRHY